MLKGSMVALVTPFSGGKFDEKSFCELIEWHIKEGTRGIIPCGTTGESATLDYDEHQRVIEVAIEAAQGRIPIVAGTGANATAETVEMTKKAQKVGANAALLVSPYYNKPSQEGIYRHYKTVAESVDLPLVLYNVPGRTASNVAPETVARLAEVKNIVAIKEASGDMKQVSEILRLCGDRITVLSGDDFTTYPLMMLGGKGVISVSANVMPREVAELCERTLQGDFEGARSLHFLLEPLNKAMFIETNPVPVKTALALMGKIAEEFRLPLCEMAPANKERVKEVLKTYRIL